MHLPQRLSAKLGLALSIAGLATAGAGAQAATAAPPAGDPWVVSVGDSYISGEAGRWAGNSDDRVEGSDALGKDAYFDAAGGEREEIRGCHRSRSAAIHIGGDVKSKNLACSGARTISFESGDGYKPGIDDGVEGRAGQTAMLERFARSRHVDMVALSIGGNDFGFGDVVADCVEGFVNPFAKRCSRNGDDLAKVNERAQERVRNAISGAIGRVRDAMEDAGYSQGDYAIVVQNYVQPIPASNRFRYSEGWYTRQTTGGCGFYDSDIDWAIEKVLPSINGTVREAIQAAGGTNLFLLDVSDAFRGHRLCEQGVGLLEETGLASWKGDGAVDKSEWIAQIRASKKFFRSAYGFEVQESLHPNYWGQLALRSCMRQAYNGGKPQGGSCVPDGDGVDRRDEPRMELR